MLEIHAETQTLSRQLKRLLIIQLNTHFVVGWDRLPTAIYFFLSFDAVCRFVIRDDYMPRTSCSVCHQLSCQHLALVFVVQWLTVPLRFYIEI